MSKFKVKGADTLMSKLLARMGSEVNTISDSAAEDLFKDMVASTPIDTGYARSRWEYRDENKGFGYKVTYSPSLVKRILSPGSAFKLFPREYILTNDADYIVYLNRGHSKQAPAFFIETVLLRNGFKIKEPVIPSPN